MQLVHFGQAPATPMFHPLEITKSREYTNVGLAVNLFTVSKNNDSGHWHGHNMHGMAAGTGGDAAALPACLFVFLYQAVPRPSWRSDHNAHGFASRIGTR